MELVNESRVPWNEFMRTYAAPSIHRSETAHDFMVIYPIKRKSEVYEYFKDYQVMVTTYWQCKICKLTVDQGREYFANEQKWYYRKRGIQVQPTVASPHSRMT